MQQISVVAKLRLFRSASSNSASAFISITGAAADAIRAAAMAGQWADNGRKGSFGAAKVTATIGATSWANSVYPDKETGGWAMPIKKAVCLAEGLTEGDIVHATIML
jgi:hypothetical protein